MPTLLPPLADDVSLRDLIDPRPQASTLPEAYELIHGVIREPSPMSTQVKRTASRIHRAVLKYLNSHPLGECAVETPHHIPQPDDAGRTSMPDWSYVSFERWPEDRPGSPTGNAWEAVPDIAVEVVSPSDEAEELHEKVREYLRGGVRLVWVVYPLAGEVHAYWPGANAIRLYAAGDELDAGDVLPGFRTPVAPLFPPFATV